MGKSSPVWSEAAVDKPNWPFQEPNRRARFSFPEASSSHLAVQMCHFYSRANHSISPQGLGFSRRLEPEPVTMDISQGRAWPVLLGCLEELLLSFFQLEFSNSGSL